MNAPAPQFGLYDGISVFSYGLTAVSYMMRDILWLRVITVVACVLDMVVYYFIRPGQPLWVQILMNGLLAVINAWQLRQLMRERAAARFDGQEAELYRGVFPRLSAVEFKRLLRLGEFRQVKAGETLIHEGGRSPQIVSLLAGELAVFRGGQRLTAIEPGRLVGEMAFLTDGMASASVEAVTDCHVFTLESPVLERALREDPDLRAGLYVTLGGDVARKLGEFSSRRVPLPVVAEAVPGLV